MGCTGVQFVLGADIFLFAVMSRLVLGKPNLLPTVLRPPSLGIKQLECEADHLVSRLRMHHAVPLLPYMFSVCGG
jgi:hypothetical protein